MYVLIQKQLSSKSNFRIITVSKNTKHGSEGSQLEFLIQGQIYSEGGRTDIFAMLFACILGKLTIKIIAEVSV